jgi:pimeloyl-ACP methyl ester carboxylesterase
LSLDTQLRDQAVDAIQKTLTRDEKSMGVILDWTKSQLMELASEFGTSAIKWRRGAVMDGGYPFAGDIMIYQAKGKKIREFIRDQIEHEQVEPPVVLLAHSLGGIACVDLLIEHDLRDKVKCLITVGSQAPFFYEIDALQTLSYGEPLPDHFPKWLNIYDLRDFLSYVGNCEGLFPGKMTDVQVDNRQPFPEAHGAYWANKQTWNEIKKVLS